jgi:hypothetical protein
MEGADRRRPNPARGLTGDEGKVGEKIQELTAVPGVAGVEEEKGRGGVSMANRGAAELRGTASVFRWPEGWRAAEE